MNAITRPQGLRGDIKVSELTDAEHDETLLKLLFHIRQENIRSNRQLFDHSRPVEEWFNAPDSQPAGEFEIQPNYAIPVRVDGAFFSLPVGMTSAVLNLGRERTITLYSGVATTTQLVLNMNDLGFMLTENDRRTLVLTGTMTTGFYAGLYGWAFEWAGNA